MTDATSETLESYSLCKTSSASCGGWHRLTMFALGAEAALVLAKPTCRVCDLTVTDTDLTS